MNIERHVFGSFKGYTTLAKSPGISAEDARQLEGAGYGFGQTEDRKYLKSLRSSPAYFTRIMRGNRRGVTRVLEGKPDDNGRPTLVMITAIVAYADWDGKLFGDISLLLTDDEVWQWAGGPIIAAVERSYPSPAPTISRKSAAKVAALVSEIERRAAAPSPVIVSAEEFSDEEIQATEALIPPVNRAQFSSACRSLSPQLTVILNKLAAEAPVQKVTFRFDPSIAMSSYGQFLLSKGLADGRLPLGDVMTYRTFGRVRREAATTSVAPILAPPPPVAEKRSAWVMWSGLAGVVLAAYAAGFVSGRFTRRQVTANSPIALVPPPTTAPATPPSSTIAPVTEKAKPATTPEADYDKPVTTPSPATEPTTAPSPPTTSPAASQPTNPNNKVAPTTEELKEVMERGKASERAMKQLKKEWKDFSARTKGRVLSLAGADGAALEKLAREIHGGNLLNSMQIQGMTTLPALIDIRKQYASIQKLLDQNVSIEELEQPLQTFQDSIDKCEEALRSATGQNGPLNPDPLLDAKQLLKNGRDPMKHLSKSEKAKPS